MAADRWNSAAAAVVQSHLDRERVPVSSRRRGVVASEHIGRSWPSPATALRDRSG